MLTDFGKSKFLNAYRREVFEPRLQEHYLAWGWARDIFTGAQQPILLVCEKVGERLIIQLSYARLYEAVSAQNYCRCGATFRLVLFYVNSIPERIGRDPSYFPAHDWQWVTSRYWEVIREELEVVASVNGNMIHPINRRVNPVGQIEFRGTSSVPSAKPLS